MKLKRKSLKRAAAAPPLRAPARALAARIVRGQDLGDRRLQLLLGAVR
jgi:hypothetical protein